MKIKISATQPTSQGMAGTSYSNVERSKGRAAEMFLKGIHSFAPKQHDYEDLLPEQVCVRKARLVYTDLEATDTSSDEEDDVNTQRIVVTKRSFTKRVVTEVALPPRTCYVDANPNESCNSKGHHLPRSTHESYIGRQSRTKKRRFSYGTGFQKSKVLRKRNGLAGKCHSYTGAMQISWGKWFAECMDPACPIRRSPDVCGLAKDAAIAYDNAASHIQGSQAVSSFPHTIKTNKAEAEACSLSSYTSGCVNLEEHSESLKNEPESNLNSTLADYVSIDSDAWPMNGTLDADIAEMLPLCLEFYSMENMLNTEEKSQSCFKAGSPSSVLEHDMCEDCISADKLSQDTVGDECSVETSFLLGSVATQSSIVVQDSVNRGALKLEIKMDTEEPIISPFLDELTVFGHEFVDAFSLQPTSTAVDTLAASPVNGPYNGFAGDGDLSAMNFELNAEALSWIGISAVLVHENLHWDLGL